MQNNKRGQSFFARAACFNIGFMAICGFYYLFLFVMQLGWYHEFHYFMGGFALICFSSMIWAIRVKDPKKDWLLRRWFSYTFGAVAVSALLTLVIALPWFEYTSLIFRLWHTNDWFYALFTMTIHLLFIFYIVISVPKLFTKLDGVGD